MTNGSLMKVLQNAPFGLRCHMIKEYMESQIIITVLFYEEQAVDGG